MKTKKIYRHGDLFFKPVSKVSGKEVKQNGSFVLAEGTATGHKHLLTSKAMTIKEAKDGKFYISLKNKGEITHEEHKLITLPIGNYEMGHEREKDWFSLSVRKVID